MIEKKVFQMYFQLTKLRARLYEAVETWEFPLIQQISRQIDDCQLKIWREQHQKKRSIG